MKMFVAVVDDACLLPHFLRHYLAVGVDQFYVAAHPRIVRKVSRMCSGSPAVVTDAFDVTDSVVGGTTAVTSMRLRYSGPDEWVLLADLDEFQVYPDGLDTTVHAAIREGANVVRGVMIDRVAADGSLPPVLCDSDVWALFPAQCRLTARLQLGIDHKCAIVKGHLAAAMAHHHLVGEKLSSRLVEIHHFKWNSRAIERIEAAIGQVKDAGEGWYVEYERVLTHWRAHGRLRWQDFVE